MPKPSRRPKSAAPSRMALETMLRAAGLRPTRQRLALAGLLFRGTHQHVSAEELHQRA